MSQELILAIVKPCQLNTKNIRNIISTISTDGTFGATQIINVSDILNVAARVLDRGEGYFVEPAGSMDFFKNTLHIEGLSN